MIYKATNEQLIEKYMKQGGYILIWDFTPTVAWINQDHKQIQKSWFPDLNPAFFKFVEIIITTFLIFA